MSRLPRVSEETCVTALANIGFLLKRRHGNHMVLRRDEPFSQVVVPDHRELD